MRRKDREITDKSEILEIIKQCDCCRLGFFDGEEVYIVPLNFGFEVEDGQITLYFHSASEGRKIDLIRQTKTACFEMDTNYKLHTTDVACECTAGFDSIIGNGTMSFVEGTDEKVKGLQLLMENLTNKTEWTFGKNMLEEVCIFKLEVTKLACKRHL